MTDGGKYTMFMTINYLIKKHIALALFSLSLVLALTSGCENRNTVYFEEGTKKVNGAELYYKIMGSGEPIVILHGGPGLEHTYFLPQMGELAENYKLIFYDQRTSGGSISSTDSSSITLGNFVEDLEGIRKAFDLDKMNLLGHSWGGMLAMFYATKYPENLNSLMLISSGGARSDCWNDFIQNINHNRTTKDSLALANLEATEELKNNNIAALQNYYKIFFKAYFYNQTFGDSLTMKFSKTTAKNMSLIDSKPLGQVLYNYNILEQLSVIECSTIIIHGEADPVPLKYAEEIHNNIVNSELIPLKQCGHFPFIETPTEFFRLIRDFMENTSN